MTPTKQEKEMAQKLAKQLDAAKLSDTTVICQMFSIEHAHDLEEINVAEFTFLTKNAMQKPGPDLPSPHTVENHPAPGTQTSTMGRQNA